MYHLYLLPLLAAVSLAAPVTYDQRQDGELNVRADLQNFVIVALVPKMNGASSLLLDALSKTLPSRRRINNLQRRRNNPTVEEEQVEEEISEQFLEPKTPYQVDISQAKSNLAKLYPAQSKSAVSLLGRHSQARHGSATISPVLTLSKAVDESPVPDVLPVKNNQYVVKLEDIKSLDNKELSKNKNEDSGLQLVGAMEQCGPGAFRDNRGICQQNKE